MRLKVVVLGTLLATISTTPIHAQNTNNANISDIDASYRLLGTSLTRLVQELNVVSTGKQEQDKWWHNCVKDDVCLSWVLAKPVKSQEPKSH